MHDVGGGARKVISDVNGRLGSDILLALWMKGQVGH